MNLTSCRLAADREWFRVAKPTWVDPLDPTYAQRVGGRWNPPNSWPTLYLNADVATARAQIRRLLANTPVSPDDLTDDAFDLITVTLPTPLTVADIVTDVGVKSAGLPASFPLDTNGVVIDHATCQAVAAHAHDVEQLDGIEARSALTPNHSDATTELAWWPQTGTTPTSVGDRMPYGQWR